MLVRFADCSPERDCAIAYVVAAGPAYDTRLGALEGPSGELARGAAAAVGFAGEVGSVVELFVPNGARARRLLLAGLGPEATDTAFEKLGATLVAKLLTSGEVRLAIDVSATPAAAADAAARVAYGAVLRGWRHDVYRTRLAAKDRPSLEEIIIVGASPAAATTWSTLAEVAAGVMFARTLTAEPANVIYPASFVERCASLRDLGIEIEVLDEVAMQAAGMGALLGVAQGSSRPPRLLVLRWAGAEGSPHVFVGKGVTFDSGGLSLKPFEAMEGMKWDMGGAAIVAGTLRALAGRKARAHVVGVCALVENMPDGNAQRPGDVVRTMSGQTVEVVNTDGEGRLILCDAMTWVQQRFEPKTLIDVATLTGAMIISLGHEYAGLFSNDDRLADQLAAVGKVTGEKLWRMPLEAAYDELLSSPIADMKNMGPREAGGITAAQFLKRFVADTVRWAHIDVAGMVWASTAGALWDKGATGYGVRLLERFVAANLEPAN